MSSPQKDPDPRKLDAYLDDALSEHERADFARQLEANRALEAEVQLQKRIDDSLKQRFLPPAPPENLAIRLREAAAVVSLPHPARRRMRLFAIASAAAVVWGVVAWQFFSPANRQPVYDPRLPLATIYETRVDDGFKPTWVCDNDHLFASTFFERQGQGLLLAAMPEGSKMVGLAYCGGLSRYTTTMLAHVDQAPVMVFVDRLDTDVRPAEPDARSGLHLFRKELGSLVLYELTPLDSPQVMDYLYAADVPPK